ncbi:aspartate/glutamate racemase family protein [Streptomyces sp. NPDC050287]|uniref:aspartate/glutamate racemase family protein n=1 Tax=Streptomyces sp. NPDC050287 TaxID=3365608 RepID=UPI00378AA17E
MTGVCRTLGVLGGMGPAATAEFLRLLAAASPADTDQDHPRLVMLSDPRIPDRTAAILDQDLAPAQRIADGLLRLSQWGADLLAVPCNTAHVFIDRFTVELPVPVVHIVDATLREAVRESPEGGWLAASTGTVVSGLYQRRAKALGYDLALPDHQIQQRIQNTSLLVKANRVASAANEFLQVTERLWEQRRLPLLGACTELPIAYEAAGLPSVMMVSSLSALARACVARLYETAEPWPSELSTGM